MMEVKLYLVTLAVSLFAIVSSANILVGQSEVPGISTALSGVVVNQRYHMYSLDSGLIAYWTLEGGTAIDVSGNGYDGNVIGATETDGVLGGALYFDGDSDYVNFGLDVPHFDQILQFSFSAWVRPESLISNSGMLFSRYNGNVEGEFYVEIMTSEKISYLREIPPYSLVSQRAAKPNNWNHVVATFDSNVMRIYIDGVLDTSRSGGACNSAANTPVIMGAALLNNGLWNTFHGSIDEARLYNRALTSEEVYAIYSASGLASATGTVLDISTTAGIAGATVELWQEGILKYSTLTQNEGLYSFGNINAGNYLLKVNAIGYYSFERVENIPGGWQMLQSVFLYSTSQLICDDFEPSPDPAWINAQGNCLWESENSVWQTNATGSQIYCTQSVGDTTWRNYDYSVDVMGNAGVDKVVNFRVYDSLHWYGLNLRSGTNEILFTKRVDNGLPNLMASAPFVNNSGLWYNLRVSCVDATFKVYVNNQHLLTVTDTADVYYSGGVGLTCYTGDFGSCDISFDNVLVTDPYPHFVFDNQFMFQVGQPISISGQLQYRDGSPYVLGQGQFMEIDNPISNSTELVSAAAGFFQFTTSPVLEGGAYAFQLTVTSANGSMSQIVVVLVEDTEGDYLTLESWYKSRAGVYLDTLDFVTNTLTRKYVPGATARPLLDKASRRWKFKLRWPTSEERKEMAFGLIREMGRQASYVFRENTAGPFQGTDIAAGLLSCFLGSGPICIKAVHGFGTNFVKAEMKYLINEKLNLPQAQKEFLNNSVDLGGLMYGAASLRPSGGISDIYGFLRFGGTYANYYTDYMTEFIPRQTIKSSSWKYGGDERIGELPDSIANFALSIQDDSGYTTIMGVIPALPNQAVISVQCPVNIMVTDALGRTGSKSFSQIPYFIYDEGEFDGIPGNEDVILIGDCQPGQLQIQVLPDTSATPDSNFTLVADYIYSLSSESLAVNLPIAQIPPNPYDVPVFDNLPPMAFALSTPSDTIFQGLPCLLSWQKSADPNPGHEVFYSLTVATAPDLADSVILLAGQDTSFLFYGLYNSAKVNDLDTLTYFWKVTAFDHWGAMVNSETRSFKLEFLCGDASGNGVINILDVTHLISYLYKGGPAPSPIAAGDASGNGTLNILDVTYLISYLYKGGPAPVCP